MPLSCSWNAKHCKWHSGAISNIYSIKLWHFIKIGTSSNSNTICSWHSGALATCIQLTLVFYQNCHLFNISVAACPHQQILSRTAKDNQTYLSSKRSARMRWLAKGCSGSCSIRLSPRSSCWSKGHPERSGSALILLLLRRLRFFLEGWFFTYGNTLKVELQSNSCLERGMVALERVGWWTHNAD